MCVVLLLSMGAASLACSPALGKRRIRTVTRLSSDRHSLPVTASQPPCFRAQPSPAARAARLRKMRVGVIDVGANSVRLLVAERRGRRLQTIEEAKAQLSLGSDIEAFGRISPPCGARLATSSAATSPAPARPAPCSWISSSPRPAARRRTAPPSRRRSAARRARPCASSRALEEGELGFTGATATLPAFERAAPRLRRRRRVDAARCRRRRGPALERRDGSRLAPPDTALRARPAAQAAPVGEGGREVARLARTGRPPPVAGARSPRAARRGRSRSSSPRSSTSAAFEQAIATLCKQAAEADRARPRAQPQACGAAPRRDAHARGGATPHRPPARGRCGGVREGAALVAARAQRRRVPGYDYSAGTADIRRVRASASSSSRCWTFVPPPSTRAQSPSPSSAHASSSSASSKLEHLVEPPPRLAIAHRDEHLDATVEIARHEVGRPDEERRLLALAEAVDARVLEVAADDRADGDPLGETRARRVAGSRCRARRGRSARPPARPRRARRSACGRRGCSS